MSLCCVRLCVCVNVLHGCLCILRAQCLFRSSAQSFRECVCVCALVHVITRKAPGELPMSQVTPSTPLLCSFFPSSLNTGLEVLNLEEITSTGQLRREITRESVIEGQHLGAASHINETLQREGGRCVCVGGGGGGGGGGCVGTNENRAGPGGGAASKN